MILFIAVLILSTVAFFIVYNLLDTSHKSRQERVLADHQKLLEQVERLEVERRSLSNELAEQEKKLIFLKHDLRPSATLANTIATQDENITPDMRRADYMLSNGIISMEQYQKALNMTNQLKMDFTAICHTLGFIDADQALAVRKQIN